MSIRDPASVPIAISRVEKGNFFPLDVEIIARWHAVQAVPALETQFERSTDPNTKGKIANALVRLDDTKAEYWDFLTDAARRVLQDTPPTPIGFDGSGRADPTHLSRELVAWASRHHMPLDQAAHRALYDVQGPILELGSADDRRAIPLLRQALASDNDFVKMQAARGLAELHDNESVPAIIRICQHAPPELASSIGQMLVYFDDPAAQSALDKYVQKETARHLRDARAHGKTPYD